MKLKIGETRCVELRQSYRPLLELGKWYYVKVSDSGIYLDVLATEGGECLSTLSASEALAVFGVTWDEDKPELKQGEPCDIEKKFIEGMPNPDAVKKREDAVAKFMSKDELSDNCLSEKPHVSFANKPFETLESRMQKLLKDPVNSPSHYDFFPELEAIEVIARSMTKEQFYGYCLGNRIKYRLRAGNKDALEQDISKSDKYLELYEEHKGKCYDN